MNKPITFLKDMPDGGQLVHLVEIEGVTAKGTLKCFITHIAEPKGSTLHTNLGYEQGTIKDLGELSRRYKARGFHTQRGVGKTRRGRQQNGNTIHASQQADFQANLEGDTQAIS